MIVTSDITSTKKNQIIETEIDVQTELQRGTKVELEHTETFKFIKEYYLENKEFPSDEEVAKHIAMDHLKESVEYYIYLDDMEKKLSSKKVEFANKKISTILFGRWY